MGNKTHGGQRFKSFGRGQVGHHDAFIGDLHIFNANTFKFGLQKLGISHLSLSRWGCRAVRVRCGVVLRIGQKALQNQGQLGKTFSRIVAVIVVFQHGMFTSKNRASPINRAQNRR